MEEEFKKIAEHLVTIEIPLEAKNPNNAYSRSANTGAGFKGMFMKKDYKNYKETVQQLAKEAMIKAYGPNYIPSSSFIAIESHWTFGTLRKKDIQNCGKLEYDAFNGIVYNDDSQIIEVLQKKRYKKNEPNIQIHIYKVTGFDYETDIKNASKAKKNKAKKNKSKDSKRS